MLYKSILIDGLDETLDVVHYIHQSLGGQINMNDSVKTKDYAKWIFYPAAFLTPVVVMLLLFRAQGFYPFGEKTLFMMDMKDQYMEFFASLRYIFSGEDSLFFSWSRSMGGNYLGLFAYYVASPLSWITALFPLKNLPDAILTLTLLKIGLCGLSFAGFAGYLWEHGVVKNRGREKSVSGTTDFRVLCLLPFAVCYALMSYNMMYSMCLMWIDGVILLPMVLLGVEKILRGKKGVHYVLALAASFICDYYTGYMVGIFTAIYLVFRVLCTVRRDSVKEYGWKTLRFILGTVFAFGLSAPLLIPVAKDLMQGKLAGASYVPDITVNFEFARLFGKFANGAYDSITNSGLPSVYCSWLSVLFAVVFLLLRRISWKEKAGAVLIAAFICFSFYNTKLDMAWHGFQYPTWFPYRYAFVLSFFLIYLAVRAVCEIAAGWDEGQGILFLHIKKDGQAASVLNGQFFWTGLGVLLAVVVSFEMDRNGQAIFEGLNGEFAYCSVAEFRGAIDRTKPLVQEIQEADNGFYRINQNYEFSKNDAMLFGYHGMTHYSSTYHAGINTVTPKLGLAQSHIWNAGYGSNPLLDSLFSVRYVLDDTKTPKEYTRLSQTENAVSYKNEYALSAVYSAPVAQTQLEWGWDVYQNQNLFLNTIAGTQTSYFTNYEFTTEQSGAGYIYTFTAASDNPVYLDLQSNNITTADVYVNEEWVGNYFSTETKCSLFLGNFTAGQTVTVRVVPAGQVTVDYAAIAELHMENLTPTLDRLRAKEMEITDTGHGKLSGKIDVADGETIMTSIPYDEGWTVKVDGKKAETGCFADAFLTVKADAGKHQITFSYVSPGFVPGVILFAAAVAGLIVFLRWEQIREKFDHSNKKNDHSDKKLL